MVAQRHLLPRGDVPALESSKSMFDSSSSSEEELYKKFTKRRRHMEVGGERPRRREPHRCVEQQPVITIKPWGRSDTSLLACSLVQGRGERGCTVKVRGDTCHTNDRRVINEVDDDDE